ncbi:MAG: GAF domain-containing protein [Gaiellaceae bacterium]
MSSETTTLAFNAVPLLAAGVAYGAVAVAVTPSLWRLRSRATATDVTLAAVFPVAAALAFLYGVLVIVHRQPLEGHLWLSFAALLLALVPPALFFARLARSGLVTSGARMHAAEERTSRLDRELSVVTDLSASLVAAETVGDVARTLIDRALLLVEAEFGALTLISDDQSEGSGVLARRGGKDLTWYSEVRYDLLNEPSGTASAVFAGAPVTVYDVQSSLLVNRRLVERIGAKSVVFVPLAADGRVLAVLVVGSTGGKRTFPPEDVALLHSLSNEAALALSRVRSSAALAAALDRERVISRITAKFRTEFDLNSVLRVALAETARALVASRAFVGLGDGASAMPVKAEWHRPQLEPIGEAAAELPTSNLAIRELRTITVPDVESDPVLRDPLLGDVDLLLGAGLRAALATPIVAFDELIGVFALHRSEPGPWSPSDIAVAEAVARETGIAVHVARLLEENAERLRQQDALLRAAQSVTAELDVERVLQRLVDEVAALLSADAADLYLRDDATGVFRCAAVHGLPEELLGFEFTPDRGLAAEAVRSGEAVISSADASLDDPVPHPAYDGFNGAMVAPVAWAGEMRGLLGVGVYGVRTFTQRDADSIGAFASLAALALRNAETFEERTRQARIQQGFYRVASVLGESLSLAETLDATAQAATEALDGSFAAVLMPRGDGRLQLAGSFELPASLRDVLRDGLPETSVLALCAEEQRVIAAPEVAADDRFGSDWQGLARAAGYAALLAVPLEAPRDNASGLVLVCFPDVHRFSDDDLELAQRLARAARGAFERSELFEAERTARALAQELARTGSVLATELDPDAVLDEVVVRAPGLVGADACAIRVVDGDELVVKAADGEGMEALIGERAPTGGWLSGDVYQSRRPIALADAKADPRHIERDAVLAAGYSSYLGVPLVGPEGTAHGVLALYTRHPRAWRREEIDAIAALAANTAAALSNAELYTSVALDRERSAAILGNVADGIVAVDRDGEVVLWNASAERITGIPAREAVGRTIDQILQRDLEAEGEQTRLVSIERGTEEVWLSVTEAVMQDPAGAVAGRIFAFRDISADRLVEEMKSEFVATVSHELRGPLTSIYGFAETLLREDIHFGYDERRTFLGYIASESERLTAIVDALLNVARLDTGDLQVTLAPTDVSAVVSEVVAGVEDAASNECSFVLDLPSEVLSATADRDKLRQVLSMLIDNALKFSPSGGTVTIGVRPAEDAIAVSVEDEGVGIPQSELERIFRKFYRAGDGAVGTGVGLFIAQGLISAMGGRISVQSEEGKGSLFTFDLPAAQAVVQEERPRV